MGIGNDATRKKRPIGRIIGLSILVVLVVAAILQCNNFNKLPYQAVLLAFAKK